MERAIYSSDIQEILENLSGEAIRELISNIVVYAHENNICKTNWIARELLTNVIDDKLISEIFDE